MVDNAAPTAVLGRDAFRRWAAAQTRGRFERLDTGLKLTGYLQVPSIRHYLLLHATKRQLIHHRRLSSASELRVETTIVTAGRIDLDPPGLTLDLDALDRLAQ